MTIAAEPRLIRAASGMRMPWKNGAGWTTVIAVWPESAGDEDFGWRLSIAEIERSQPYSIFPGVDRRQLLLSGPGLVLTGSGERHLLAAPYDVAGFSGDSVLTCEPAGPCRVLNVMTRRGIVDAEISILRGSVAVSAGSGYLVLYVTAGEYRLSASDVEGHQVLGAADALIVEGAEIAADGGADAVMVAVRFEISRV